MSEYKVDYANVSSHCTDRSGIVTDIKSYKRTMVNSDTSTQNAGLFSDEFETLRTETDTMISDICDFMENYARIVLSVSKNYEALDKELSDLI